jgi:hypothetical protein
MMFTLEWYSERIKEEHCKELELDKLKGRKYILNCGEKNGYIIYNDIGYFFRYNALLAYGKFGETELIVKKTGNWLGHEVRIYDKASDACIGNLSYQLSYRGLQLRSYEKTKWIIDRNNGFDLVFDIYSGRSKTILSMQIHKIKKKWYNNVYNTEIKGTIALEEEPNWEFILCAFFMLHYSIRAERSSG